MTSARKKLAKPISVKPKISQTQFHAAPNDLNHGSIVIYGTVITANAKGDVVPKPIRADITGAVQDVDIDLSMEVASTATITMRDPRGTFLNSGVLFAPDVPLADHLLQALISDLPMLAVAQVRRQSGGITITCEDATVHALRKQTRPKTVASGVMTAQEFIKHLVEEVGAKFVCPDLDILSGNEADAESATETASHAPGFPAGTVLKVKGQTADSAQMSNLSTIISVGLKAGVRKKVIVAAIMTCIQEATARNLPGGDADSVGLFQQRASWGSFTERHTPAISAAKFYRACAAEDKQHPNESLWELCANTQRPAEQYRTYYDHWKKEAFAILDAYTGKDGDAQTVTIGAGYSATPESETESSSSKKKNKKSGWSRGLPNGPVGESSWDCIQRMTQDLGYHCWSDFWGDTIYLMEDRDAIAAKPRVVLSEDTQSVDYVDFDCDVGKSVESATVYGSFAMSTAPPGSVVLLKRSGPANGRWLVNDFRRGLFTAAAEIDLKRAQPGIGDRTQAGDSSTVASPRNSSSQQNTSAPQATGSATASNATGAALRRKVLASSRIDLTSYDRRNHSDVQNDLINDDLLRLLLTLSTNGFSLLITALRSNHHNDGPNGHYGGKAADIGRVNGSITRDGDHETRHLMQWVYDHQHILKWRQLFGPVAELNFYSPTVKVGSVLEGHHNHIHIGV